MSSWWPWVALAGAGALHGLNPCAGWLLLALRRPPVRAGLAPVAAGHLGAVGLVAVVVALEPAAAGRALQAGALGLACVALAWWWRGRGRPDGAATRGPLALASFVASVLAGSGMMLVPALVPLCLGDAPAREITATGSWPVLLAALGVHLSAMLATTALAAGAARTLVAPKSACRDRVFSA